jgi:opacity protein-like surface antigen
MRRRLLRGKPARTSVDAGILAAAAAAGSRTATKDLSHDPSDCPSFADLCEREFLDAHKEAIMKRLAIVVALIAVVAAPVCAQESGVPNKGYVSAFGGAVWAGGNSTGSVLFEGGARIAPHVMVFGNVGRFANLQADLQPTLDATTTALSDEGLGVTAGGKLPAWYGVGGARAEIGAGKHAVPYALAGIGAARLNPTPQFAFSNGIMPDGSTPTVGTDVTATLVSAGTLTTPAPSTALMVMLGGGVQIPLVPHFAVDVGYRYSRIAADTTLNAGALNTNVMTFGVGYRF